MINITATEAVRRYRKAARELFGISEVEAETYIVEPENDPGGWAPGSLGIVYLEADCRKDGDNGDLPGILGYYSPNGMENGFSLDAVANCEAHIEYINAAVAAIWPN